MSLIEACPKPGIYCDIPFDEYLSWAAISNSSLHAAAKSMAHYNAQQPVEETPPMRLGTLCHAGKFEPLLISQQYAVVPESKFAAEVRKPDGSMYDSPRGSKAYKELVADFKEKHAGKIFVSDTEFNTMLGVVRALSLHERASEYLAVRTETQNEVAIVWIDEETGLLCKGRVDCLQRDRRLVGDLKTTADASQFHNVIARRGYHRQGAFYLDGLEQLTGVEHTFTITAVETSSPYDVQAAPLSAEAINIGRTQYRTLLRQIAECREANVWPGSESPEEWQLPAWALGPDTMRVESGVLVSW
ncbi:PD-(D/E)XK nuclease-like domain-containing protein [Schlesneria sp. T3-172]|uniref:PD-(D/E)XK nuclease-like domain-containing protein n=1 Tax=Schlesneria sphaerica TaxID=3373610 RepID=UPI0037C9C778